MLNNYALLSYKSQHMLVRLDLFKGVWEGKLDIKNCLEPVQFEDENLDKVYEAFKFFIDREPCLF
jgi:hypothetical protein